MRNEDGTRERAAAWRHWEQRLPPEDAVMASSPLAALLVDGHRHVTAMPSMVSTLKMQSSTSLPFTASQWNG
jgi:hypothetical protein